MDRWPRARARASARGRGREGRERRREARRRLSRRRRRRRRRWRARSRRRRRRSRRRRRRVFKMCDTSRCIRGNTSTSRSRRLKFSTRTGATWRRDDLEVRFGPRWGGGTVPETRSDSPTVMLTLWCTRRRGQGSSVWISGDRCARERLSFTTTNIASLETASKGSISSSSTVRGGRFSTTAFPRRSTTRTSRNIL